MVVNQREIVEVKFPMPEGGSLVHPALVVSTKKLIDAEEIFYAVLISSKNHHPEFTLQLQSDWLSKESNLADYFVTHIISSFFIKL